MIRHFGVYPTGFDKDNLFDEQKIFLVYLLGLIPSLDDWSVQMDYKTKLQRIKDIKKISIDKTDLDVAKMQGKDIDELKRKRLIQEKERQTSELKDSFGIKEEPKEINIEGLPEPKEKPKDDKYDHLWDMLDGKGLVTSKEKDD